MIPNDTLPETTEAKTTGSYMAGAAAALSEVTRSLRELGDTLSHESGKNLAQGRRFLLAFIAASLLSTGGIGWLLVRQTDLNERVDRIAARLDDVGANVDRAGKTTEATKEAVDDAAELVAARPQVDIEVQAPPASASASAKPKAVVVIRPRKAPGPTASASAPLAPSVVIPIEVPSGPTSKGKP